MHSEDWLALTRGGGHGRKGTRRKAGGAAPNPSPSSPQPLCEGCGRLVRLVFGPFALLYLSRAIPPGLWDSAEREQLHHSSTSGRSLFPRREGECSDQREWY